MPCRDILADRLRALMLARPDLDTQTKLARSAGLSQSTIQRVLARDVHTSLHILEEIARAFGVTPTDLIAPQASPTNAIVPTPDELAVLAAWRRLAPAERHNVMAYMAVAHANATTSRHRSTTIDLQHTATEVNVTAWTGDERRTTPRTIDLHDHTKPPPRKRSHRKG